MIAALHVTTYDLAKFKGWKDLYKFLDIKRMRLKKVMGVSWDNSHYWFVDHQGIPRLVFVITEHETANMGISLYLSSSEHCKSYTDFEKFKKYLPKVLENVAKGKFYCKTCRRWKANKSKKHYSFAGVVCSKCFDPKIHQAPNTMGD